MFLARRAPLPLALLLLLTGGPAAAPAAQEAADRPPAGFSLRTFTDDDGDHLYSLFVPRTPPPPAGYPIVLFLHGAYERGTDGIAPTTAGIGPVIKEDRDFPAVVVFPQVEDPDGRILPAWNPDRPDGARALKILEEAEGLVRVDETHRVLAGWSMGGYGVLGQLAKGDPMRWSAAVSVSSGLAIGVDPEEVAEASRVTPLWIVAGEQDRYVPFVETERAVRLIREAGGRVRFTAVRNAGHGVWETVFAADRFADILRNPRVIQPREADAAPGEADQTVTDLADEDEFDASPAFAPNPEVFQPDLILNRGAFVRADNALMTKLAGQFVRNLPPDTLTGTIPDQNITRSALGQTIRVNFSGISYSGRVTDAAVRGHDGNCVTVRVELADARVTVRCIRLRAPLGHRGVAGPVTIRAGVRRPLVLEVDIRPAVVNGELKLMALGTRFALPPDDYFVCGPGCVDEDGLFLTEAKLAKQLVEGLYEARTQGEQAVRDAVPGLLGEVGGGTDFGNPGGLAGSVLPLPLVEPIVQVKLADVRADASGLTALFDLEIASPTLRPMARTAPERADGGITLDLAGSVARPEELEVGVSVDLLRLLSGALTEGDVPRIDARDVPGDPLRELHRRENLVRIVPGLDDPEFADHELRARLTLVGPVEATAFDSDRNALVRMDSDAVEMTIDHLPPEGDRPPGEDWRRAAVLRLSLRQPIRASIRKNGAYRNFVAVAEGEEANIAPVSARAEVGETVDEELAASLLGEGWDNWLDEEGPFSGPLQDFELPGASLRIEEFATRAPAPGARGGVLLARFMVPDTSLENRSEFALTYRVRAEPGGPWGGPFTLAPGETHTYKVRDALRFEQVGAAPGAGAATRLEVGASYQYRVPVGAVFPTLDRTVDPADEVTLVRPEVRPWYRRTPVARGVNPALTAAPAAPAAGPTWSGPTWSGPTWSDPIWTTPRGPVPPRAPTTTSRRFPVRN